MLDRLVTKVTIIANVNVRKDFKKKFFMNVKIG
jgi:hypothetical protein